MQAHPLSWGPVFQNLDEGSIVHGADKRNKHTRVAGIL